MSHKANYWLAQLDPTLVKAGAFRVLFHLCDHHNDERDPTRACFPSQETLRARTGMANGTLNSALAQMEEAGLLRRVRSTIPGTRTRRTYYVLGCDFAAVEEQTPKSGVSSANSGEPELEGQNGMEQTPVFDVTNSGFEANKLRCTGEEPVRNKKERSECPEKKSGHTQNGFSEFWEAYPRSRNRAETEKGYELAIGSGVSPRWLIHAAKAYRAEQAGNSKAYMCSSENWLAQRRWENFPLKSDAGPETGTVSDDLVFFWAQKVNGGKYVSPNAISTPVAAAMLERNLVTLDRLRQAGVAV